MPAKESGVGINRSILSAMGLRLTVEPAEVA